MTGRELERLSSWLRCYPVVGREDERKALTEIVERELKCSTCGRFEAAHPTAECPAFSVAEASDNCRPDGAPILCGAELRIDPADEFADTYKCVLAQGHERKCHKTWDGKLFQ